MYLNIDLKINSTATEIPNVPVNLEVNSMMSHTSQTSYPVSLRWDAPDNINKFDLEHFRIQVFSSDLEKEYVLNVTSTELKYPFGLNSSVLQSSLNLIVSAVSKCSQQGPPSLPAIVVETGTGSLDTVSPANYQLDTEPTVNGMIYCLSFLIMSILSYS